MSYDDMSGHGGDRFSTGQDGDSDRAVTYILTASQNGTQSICR